MIFGMDNLAIAEMLGGYMAGVTVSGVLWAIFQNNAGGAWDNAKKSFEAGVEINGEMTYKGSEAHKAAVTGDTVGDPFKDTSGPSMNILIKLTCLIGLVIAPILGGHSEELNAEMTFNSIDNKVNQEISINVDDANSITTLNITTSKVENGVATEITQSYEGTKDEIMGKLDELKIEGKILKMPVPPTPPNN
jgi:K(+)-stimulated pyrophosphate-energized sodium pump